jgi:bifunctional phosphoserine phosphatase/homoserine phosphotransferase
MARPARHPAGDRRDGAAARRAAFLDWLRERFQVVILSDTFYEFAMPLMRQLGYPALFCHKLVVDDAGATSATTSCACRSRSATSVKAFKALNFKVIAAGDSYNDTAMLAEARTPASCFVRRPMWWPNSRSSPRPGSMTS